MKNMIIVPVQKRHEEDYGGFTDTWTETRYEIVDPETGEVLDDAQGYGYRSIQKARAAWNYKNRDKSKDFEKAEKEREIMRWMKELKGFVRCMEQNAFEIAKGSWGPDDKFDAKLVQEMLDEGGYNDVPFTAKELLRVWGKGPKFAKWGEV